MDHNYKQYEQVLSQILMFLSKEYKVQCLENRKKDHFKMNTGAEF